MRIFAWLVAALCVGVFSAPAHAERFVWPNGAKLAVVLTYDDALATHLDVAAPHLDAAGLKGAFFINQTFPVEQLPRWRALAERGHELANHTIFHPCLAGTFDMPARQQLESYTVETLMREIYAMNTFLAALDGRPAHTYAMTCGQTLAGGQDYVEALRGSGFVTAARGVGGSPGDSVAALDLFRVPAVWPDDKTTGAQMIAQVQEAARKGGLLVFGFHGVGGDHLPVQAKAHEELVAYLAAHRKEIWTATFAEATAYIAQSRAAAQTR